MNEPSPPRWRSRGHRRGRPNEEIPSTLAIGEKTVETHVSNTLTRPHAADRARPATQGLWKRLVPLDEALE